MAAIRFRNDYGRQVTGLFRGTAFFAQGEVPNEAALANRVIRIGGSTFPVYWRAFGKPHRGNSVRFATADATLTLAAGQQVVADVVAGTNNPPALSFPLESWITGSGLLTSSFEDRIPLQQWATGDAWTPRSRELLSIIRSFPGGVGPNQETWSAVTWGGRRIYRISAYIGRGRHHRALRSTGSNASGVANPPIEITGGIHARAWISLYHGQAVGDMVFGLFADTPYPFPAQPPDGGTRQSGDPGRPTRIARANGEFIEDSLGKSIRIPRVRCQGGVFHAPKGVRNLTNGAGPCPQLPIADANGSTWELMILGLADRQGYAVRYGLGTTAALAAEHARFGYSMIGLPTYETQLAVRRRGFLTGAFAALEMELAGFEFPFPEVEEAIRLQYRAEGPIRLQSRMAENRQPWDLMGYNQSPGTSGGPQAQILFQGQGRILAGESIPDVELLEQEITREYSARPSTVNGIRHMVLPKAVANGQQNGMASAPMYFWGDALERTSFNALGRFQSVGAYDRPIWRHPVTGEEAPVYFGNPDANANAGGELLHAGNNAEHLGLSPLFNYYMVTQDPFALDRLVEWACIHHANEHEAYFFTQAAWNMQSRGFMRSSRGIFQALLATNDSFWSDRLLVRVGAWLDSWRPIGRNPNDRNDLHLRRNGHEDPEWRSPHPAPFSGYYFWPWQNSPLSAYFALLAFELADLSPSASERCMAAAEALVKRILRCWMVDGTRAPFAGITMGAIDAGFAANAANAADGGVTAAIGAACSRRNLLSPGDTSLDGSLIVTPPAGYPTGNWLGPASLRGGGENNDSYPAMVLAEIFPSIQADAYLRTKAAFVRGALETSFPELRSGAEMSGSKGVVCGRWVPSSQGSAPSPSFVANPIAGRAPLLVSFDGRASIVFGGLTAGFFRWHAEWIDGQVQPSASGQGLAQVGHTYHTPGVYSVRLAVRDAQGREGEVIFRDLITVQPEFDPPQITEVRADPVEGWAPLRVQFGVNLSGGPVTDIRWSFGDGSSATGADPSYTYAEGGEYTVVCTVRGPGGESSVALVRPILVREYFYEAPRARFRLVSGGFVSTTPSVVEIEDVSTPSDPGAQLLRDWTWSDGAAVQLTESGNVRRTFVDGGVYHLMLAVSDPLGRTDSFSRQFTVHALVVSQVPPVPVETNETVLLGPLVLRPQIHAVSVSATTTNPVTVPVGELQATLKTEPLTVRIGVTVVVAQMSVKIDAEKVTTAAERSVSVVLGILLGSVSAHPVIAHGGEYTTVDVSLLSSALSIESVQTRFGFTFSAGSVLSVGTSIRNTSQTGSAAAILQRLQAAVSALAVADAGQIGPTHVAVLVGQLPLLALPQASAAVGGALVGLPALVIVPRYERLAGVSFGYTVEVGQVGLTAAATAVAGVVTHFGVVVSAGILQATPSPGTVDVFEGVGQRILVGPLSAAATLGAAVADPGLTVTVGVGILQIQGEAETASPVAQRNVVLAVDALSLLSSGLPATAFGIQNTRIILQRLSLASVPASSEVYAERAGEAITRRLGTWLAVLPVSVRANLTDGIPVLSFHAVYDPVIEFEAIR